MQSWHTDKIVLAWTTLLRSSIFDFLPLCSGNDQCHNRTILLQLQSQHHPKVITSYPWPVNTQIPLSKRFSPGQFCNLTVNVDIEQNMLFMNL